MYSWLVYVTGFLYLNSVFLQTSQTFFLAVVLSGIYVRAILLPGVLFFVLRFMFFDLEGKMHWTWKTWVQNPLLFFNSSLPLPSHFTFLDFCFFIYKGGRENS